MRMHATAAAGCPGGAPWSPAGRHDAHNLVAHSRPRLMWRCCCMLGRPSVIMARRGGSAGLRLQHPRLSPHTNTRHRDNRLACTPAGAKGISKYFLAIHDNKRGDAPRLSVVSLADGVLHPVLIDDVGLAAAKVCIMRAMHMLACMRATHACMRCIHARRGMLACKDGAPLRGRCGVSQRRLVGRREGCGDGALGRHVQRSMWGKAGKSTPNHLACPTALQPRSSAPTQTHMHTHTRTVRTVRTGSGVPIHD